MTLLVFLETHGLEIFQSHETGGIVHSSKNECKDDVEVLKLYCDIP
jgi:hypothetical protein